MLTVIHWWKKTQRSCEVLLTIGYWSNRQIRPTILASLFISFQIKSCIVLLMACRRSKPAVRRNS